MRLAPELAAGIRLREAPAMRALDPTGGGGGPRLVIQRGVLGGLAFVPGHLPRQGGSVSLGVRNLKQNAMEMPIVQAARKRLPAGGFGILEEVGLFLGAREHLISQH